MTIGERIKNRRVELGMTQQELADKVGYKAKTAISKIEAGERDLRQTKIRPMAEALDTSIEYLMGWDEEEEPKPVGYDMLKQFTDLIWEMSDEEKSDLMNYMNFIISKRK